MRYEATPRPISAYCARTGPAHNRDNRDNRLSVVGRWRFGCRQAPHPCAGSAGADCAAGGTKHDRGRTRRAVVEDGRPVGRGTQDRRGASRATEMATDANVEALTVRVDALTAAPRQRARCYGAVGGRIRAGGSWPPPGSGAATRRTAPPSCRRGAARRLAPGCSLAQGRSAPLLAGRRERVPAGMADRNAPADDRPLPGRLP